MTEEQLIEGIDVSHYQGAIDWGKVARSGKVFAYCKASEGVTIKDHAFAAHMMAGRALGVRMGAYHFLAGGTSGEAQAKAFLSVYCWRPRDLPPVLDLEVAGKGETPASLWVRVTGWLKVVEAEAGIMPIIYCAADFMRRYHAAEIVPDLPANPLWVAHWGVTAPIIPPPWKDWLIWQKSNKGRVPGIRGDVDLDVARPSLLDGCGA